MERPPDPIPDERGEQNELGFFDADEEATYGERESQGQAPGEDLDHTVTEEP